MNWSASQFKPSARTLVAVLTGLLWTAAFPKVHFAAAAWIAPGLLWLLVVGRSPGEAFRLGYVAGLVHHLTALYWLIHIPFFPGNWLAWISLSAFCGLYPAIWTWLLARWMNPRRSSAEEGTTSRVIGFGPVKFSPAVWTTLDQLLDAPWWRRQLWWLGAAAAWTGLEFFRGWFLSGFPWNFLGASQYRQIPLIQIASVTGVHGLTFLVVWVSVTLAAGAAVVLTRPHLRFAWKNEILLSVPVLLALVVHGVTLTTRPVPAPERTVRLALVQPSIPQRLIFDPDEVSTRFEQLLALSREALAGSPDILVWPEMSLPALDRADATRLFQLIREHDAWFIFGGDDADQVELAEGDTATIWFNAAYLFDHDARRPRAVYRKQRLVIFGEYVPLQRWLPFLNRLTPVEGGFGRGEAPVRFELPELDVVTSVNICFEDNFADLVRAQVEPDTDFLLNLTNNGWFGESAAQWQHAMNAVFRAVENRVPLVRCTNNGLTCWIDPEGRLHAVGYPDERTVYDAGIRFVEVPLLDAPRQPTFYHRHGDAFAWLCFTATALIALPRVLGVRSSKFGVRTTDP